MQKVYIIGLTGKKGHGKSTAAEYITDKYKDRATIIHINFKDAIVRDMKAQMPRTLQGLAEYYGYSITDLFYHKPPMMHTLMQEFGTDIYRHLDTDWWINEWAISVVNALQTNGYSNNNLIIITDDVRFKNEYERIKSQGGNVYRIVRSDYVDSSNTSHVSETEMDGFDCTSFTAQNPEELYKQLDSLNLL